MLGRLQYATLVLQYLRPFLGPLYAWASAVPGGACLPMPGAIRLILSFMLKLLKVGPAMVKCKPADTVTNVEYRADAKAEGDDVGVGGWRVDPRGPEYSKWFALKLNRQNAPWAFRSGEPFRTIASLELFGTLLCIKLLAPQNSPSSKSTISVTAQTDNRGNSFAVAKLMTVKFPLCAFLMEISAHMQREDQELDLNWVPREQNCEADELSNMDTKRFREENRVECDLDQIQFIILPELLDEGERFYQLVEKVKAAAPPPTFAPGMKRKRKPETRLRATHPW